jgi:hypothetical protein
MRPRSERLIRGLPRGMTHRQTPRTHAIGPRHVHRVPKKSAWEVCRSRLVSGGEQCSGHPLPIPRRYKGRRPTRRRLRELDTASQIRKGGVPTPQGRRSKTEACGGCDSRTAPAGFSGIRQFRPPAEHRRSEERPERRRTALRSSRIEAKTPAAGADPPSDAALWRLGGVYRSVQIESSWTSPRITRITRSAEPFRIRVGSYRRSGLMTARMASVGHSIRSGKLGATFASQE